MSNFLLPGIDLIRKYNKQVPRYTSYPTVPYWQDDISPDEWKERASNTFHACNKTDGISLYIHLPFCESLCTYCGCNKKITTNHSVEEEYIKALEKEWSLYLQLFKEKPVIRELHLGGGTPTFFSAANLAWLLGIIFSKSSRHPLHEFSIEGHPNNTTFEQLQVLYAFGFRRISYGVQDLDEKVQYMINRIQPFSNVAKATAMALKAGFTSINFDLIYGLPFQTVESISKTFHQVLQLKPGRIAFYSYAHVPWKSRGQRLFDETDLPSAENKLQLYLTGKQILNEAGYQDIGMDHFALPGDALYTAYKDGTLHRNFMGYTTCNTGMLVGLGVSAISDAGNGYAQNEKQLLDYYRCLNDNKIPVVKGYFLSKEDERFKRYILDIICGGKAFFSKDDLPVLKEYCFPQLALLQADGLISFNDSMISVINEGHYFLRNICYAVDVVAARGAYSEALFSKAI